MTLSIIPVRHIGEAQPGDDAARLLADGLQRSGVVLQERDVLVVTHKLVSKAEGRLVEVGSDPQAHADLIEREAAAVLRRRDGLVITETRHGLVCANAGVDRSNIAPGWAALLPADPDRSARRIRLRLEEEAGVKLGVIISDTHGRAWRHGLVDVAIGVSGLAAIADHRGRRDAHGNILEVTEVAVADEAAAAAELVMGKTRQIPAAVIRGLEFPDGEGRAADLIRRPADDLFR